MELCELDSETMAALGEPHAKLELEVFLEPFELRPVGIETNAEETNFKMGFVVHIVVSIDRFGSSVRARDGQGQR